MKRIKDPYDFALFEIKRAEDTLRSLANANKVRFAYKDGFLVIQEETLKQMEKSSQPMQRSIDSLTKKLTEAISEGKYTKKRLRQTLKKAERNLAQTREIVKDARGKGKLSLADSIERVWIPDQIEDLKKIRGLINTPDISLPKDTDRSAYEYFAKQYKPDSVTLVHLSAQSYYADTTMFAYIFDEYPDFAEFIIEHHLMPINEVKNILSEKSEEFKESKQSEIELLGLKVNIDNSHLIAPFACIALELYLLSLLWHILLLLHTTSESRLVREYPWVFLFDNYLAIGICTASIFFPFLATEQMLAKAGIRNWWYWAYGVSHMILMLAIMLIAFVVRKKAHETPNIDGI